MKKATVYLILSITTGIGAWIAVLLGADTLGGWSLLGSFIGGIVGVYAITKLP